MQTAKDHDAEGNVTGTHDATPEDRSAVQVWNGHGHPPTGVRHITPTVSTQNSDSSTALHTGFPGQQAAEAGSGTGQQQAGAGTRTGFGAFRLGSGVGRGSGSGTSSGFGYRAGFGTRSGFGEGRGIGSRSALGEGTGFGTRPGVGAGSTLSTMGTEVSMLTQQPHERRSNSVLTQSEMTLDPPTIPPTNGTRFNPGLIGTYTQDPQVMTMQQALFQNQLGRLQAMQQEALSRAAQANFFAQFGQHGFNEAFTPTTSTAYNPINVLQTGGFGSVSPYISESFRSNPLNVYNGEREFPNPLNMHGGRLLNPLNVYGATQLPPPDPNTFIDFSVPRGHPGRLQRSVPVDDTPQSPDDKPKKRIRKLSVKALLNKQSDEEEEAPSPEPPKKKRAKKSTGDAAPPKKASTKKSKADKVKEAQKLSGMASLPATLYAYEAGLLPDLPPADGQAPSGLGAATDSAAAPGLTAPGLAAPDFAATGLGASTFGNLSAQPLPRGTEIIPFETGEHEVALQESLRENGFAGDNGNATNVEEPLDDITFQFGDNGGQSNVYEGYISRQPDTLGVGSAMIHQPYAMLNHPTATNASPIRETADVMRAKFSAFHDYFINHFEDDQAVVNSFKSVVTSFQEGKLSEVDFYKSVYHLVYLNESTRLTEQFRAFLPPAWQGEAFMWLHGTVAANIEKNRTEATEEEISAMETAFEQKNGRKPGRPKKAPVNGFRASGNAQSDVNGALNSDAADVPPAVDGQDDTQEAFHRLPRPTSTTHFTASDDGEEPEPSSDGEYSPARDLKSSDEKRHMRSLRGEEVPHFGEVYKTRREILIREDRPYICDLCGEDFRHPADVAFHHGGSRPSVVERGCWAKNGKPEGTAAQWDAHGSCKVGLKDLEYTRVKDGFVILDQKSLDKIEAACELGRKFKEDNAE